MSTTKKILLLDSNDKTRMETSRLLNSHGYTVIEASTRAEALEHLGKESFDTAILDTDISDFKNMKLNGEADYYIVTACKLDDLRTRIETVPQRLEPVIGGRSIGEMVFDPVSHRVTYNGRSVELSSKEYRLLDYLVRHRGQILTRQQLLRDVWDRDFDTNTNVVNVYIRYLRDKIGDPYPGQLIRTVAGQGYCFGEPTTQDGN